MNQYIEFMEIESQIEYLRYQLEALELKLSSLKDSHLEEEAIYESSFVLMTELEPVGATYLAGHCSPELSTEPIA